MNREHLKNSVVRDTRMDDIHVYNTEEKGIEEAFGCNILGSRYAHVSHFDRQIWGTSCIVSERGSMSMAR